MSVRATSGGNSFQTTPDVPVSSYFDMFGNACRRFIVPPEGLTISADGIIKDSGLHDAVMFDAPEVPVAQLPDECLVYLLGSRYSETDRLSQIAWDLFGGVKPGWARVQAICDFVHQSHGVRLSACARDPHGVRYV